MLLLWMQQGSPQCRDIPLLEGSWHEAEDALPSPAKPSSVQPKSQGASLSPRLARGTTHPFSSLLLSREG